MRKFSVFLSFTLFIFFLTPVSNTTAAPLSGVTWTFTTDNVNLGLSGVSPYVEKLSSGLDRLYFASPLALPDPIMVVDCTDSGSCTRQTLSSRFNPDATIVTLKDGTRRLFMVNMSPSSGKSIQFATLGANGLSHGSATSIGVAGSDVSSAETAWGVPDAVVLPDGRVRVYWVIKDQATGKPNLLEALASATSTDASANTFIRDAGFRLTGGFVDSKILRAQDNDWVMIVSTGPEAGTQFLYIATSSDGLTWQVSSSPISSSSESALDPTGYEVSSNTWRIYYASAAPGKTVNRTYTIKRATLSWSPAPSTAADKAAADKAVADKAAADKAVADKKKTTITCTKGKLIKKVSGTAPKCPSGWKKK